MLVGDPNAQGDRKNPQENQQDMRGLRGRRSGGWTGPAPLRCGWEVGRGSHAWGDPRGLGSEGSGPSISPAQSAGDVCPALGPGPMPSEVLSRPGWSWGCRRKAWEIRRGRWEGPSGTRGAGKEQREFAPPTRTKEACWAPRWGPPPPETRGRRHAWAPSVLLSLSPTPHTSQGLFQPCGS